MYVFAVISLLFNLNNNNYPCVTAATSFALQRFPFTRKAYPAPSISRSVFLSGIHSGCSVVALTFPSNRTSNNIVLPFSFGFLAFGRRATVWPSSKREREIGPLLWVASEGPRHPELNRPYHIVVQPCCRGYVLFYELIDEK